jgi:nucleotidyltransferase/DNA polymerase involved in DNA repair
VLDVIADQFTGPLFAAALELWVAARSDPALHDAVAALERRIGRMTHRLTVSALGVDESRPGVRELVQATLDLGRGLGLANTLADDRARRERILDQWAKSLTDQLEAAR